MLHQINANPLKKSRSPRPPDELEVMLARLRGDDRPEGAQSVPGEAVEDRAREVLGNGKCRFRRSFSAVDFTCSMLCRLPV